MKETVLGFVPENTRFFYGGAEFFKVKNSTHDEEFVQCYVGNSIRPVLITACAGVIYDDGTNSVLFPPSDHSDLILKK